MIIQKRSANKDSNPNKWDVSSAGHISSGDKPEETGIREVKEELGISVELEQMKKLFISKQESITNNGTFINKSFAHVYLVGIIFLFILI